MSIRDTIVSTEIDDAVGRLGYAVLIEERGKMFLIGLLSSGFAAEKLAKAGVDDALPHNTVAVFHRSRSDGQWKLHGRASMTGDGGSQFVKVVA